jgi:hypothetical protein
VILEDLKFSVPTEKILIERSVAGLRETSIEKASSGGGRDEGRTAIY